MSSLRPGESRPLERRADVARKVAGLVLVWPDDRLARAEGTLLRWESALVCAIALGRRVVAGDVVIGRFLGFAAVWLVLTERSIGGWPVALATIAAATAASARLLPGPVGRWRAAGVLRFVPFFLYQSLAGGVDVAARAIRPSAAIEPRMIIFSLRLPEGPARRLFAGGAGLLPGTLAARLAGDEVTIHVLDTALPTRDVLRRLEARTADVFGVALNSKAEGDRRRM